MQRDKCCSISLTRDPETATLTEAQGWGEPPPLGVGWGDDQASDCENVGSIKSVILQVTHGPIPRSSLHARNDTGRKRKASAVFALGVSIPMVTMDNAVCLFDQNPLSRDWCQSELTEVSLQNQ